MVQVIQNKGFHARFSPQYLSAYSQRRGWSRWVGTPNALWISKRRTKAALTGCRAALPPSKLLKTGCRFQFVAKFQLGAFFSKVITWSRRGLNTLVYKGGTSLWPT